MQKCGGALILLLGAIFSAAPIAGFGGRNSVAPAERIYFSALNKEERPVLGLKATDFELRVDGKPAPMEGFQAALPHTDRSIPMVAWILVSYGPTIESQAIEKQANAVAAAFQMLNPASAMGIKLVSDRSETLAPLEHNPTALRGALLQYSERRAELRVGIQNDSVALGSGGMGRALELAIDEIDPYIASQASLQGREVRRAAMIISAGTMNWNYSLKPLYAKAGRESVFLYPVFVPPGRYLLEVSNFFELAQKTAGVASVEGALRPGSKLFPRNNQESNALTFNFIHMIRDINGKYSFTIVPPPEGREIRLDVKCRVKGVQIRLPRSVLP